MDVIALTFPDADRELPPQQVQGELTRRYVEVLDYTQYLVGGMPVQPQTIRTPDGEPVALSADDPDRGDTESVSPLVDSIIDRGMGAGLVVSDEIRRKVRRAVLDLQKKKSRGGP